MTRINKLAIASLMTLPLAFAQQPAEKAKETPKVAVAAPAPVAQGMVVVKDAETGAIRQATPAEIGKLSPTNLLLDSVTGAPTVKADGSRSVRLGADNMNFVVVTKGADGKLTTTEVVGEKKADDLVRNELVRKGEVK
jgi:hypothetical protein